MGHLGRKLPSNFGGEGGIKGGRTLGLKQHEETLPIREIAFFFQRGKKKRREEKGCSREVPRPELPKYMVRKSNIRRLGGQIL